MHISAHAIIRIDRTKETLEATYDDLFPVFKRYEKYYTIKINDKDMNISVDRLKLVYLLMTDVNIPDYELLDKALLPLRENKLTSQPSTKNEQSDLPDKNVQEKISCCRRHKRFLRHYRNLLYISAVLFHTYLIFALIVFCIYHIC